jgi:hypothetical protein
MPWDFPKLLQGAAAPSGMGLADSTRDGDSTDGGVAMKIWPISVVLVSLAAAPLNAAMVQSDEGDASIRCAVVPARVIADGSEAQVVFPQDVNQCQTGDGETGKDSQNETPRLVPANAPGRADGSVDLATLRLAH